MLPFSRCTGRTIGREDGAIDTLKKAGAEASFLFAHEGLGFVGAEFGKVVNMFAASAAKADAVITGHVFPSGKTG